MFHIYPRISIVTPSFNQGLFIEQTILSVLNQKYPNLEYIIIDGGSTDNTLKILEKFHDKLIWISEPDLGMYDAINKGFKMCTGDILAWMNSDDIYLNNAFQTVAKIFSQNKEVNWLTGRCAYIDENGITTRIAPKKLYNTELIIEGFYRAPYTYVINQNVVFWRKTLWDKSGGCNINYQSAGDFELWTRFAKHSDLYFFDHVFSAFRSHKDQKTSNIKNYIAELKHVPTPSISTIVNILLGKQYKAFQITVKNEGEFNTESTNLNPKYLKPCRILANVVKYAIKGIIK